MPKKKQVEEEQPGIEDGLLVELLSEEECRQRIAAILRGLPDERKRLNAALSAYRAVQHRAWLAVSFMRDDLLKKDEAKKAVLDFKSAILQGLSKPPIKEDKVALCELEVGAEHLEYDLAKMAVEASETDHDMLNSQLIWYSSIRKNEGPTVPLERSVGAAYSPPPVNYPSSEEIYRHVERDLKELDIQQEAFVPPVPSWADIAAVADPEDLASPNLPVGRLQESVPISTEPEPLFPEAPIAENSWDLVKPEQLARIKELGAEKGCFENGVCYGLMECQPSQLTIEAADAFIKYLENYVTPPEEGDPANVDNIYGGAKTSRMPNRSKRPREEYVTTTQHPDGTVTPYVLDDSEIPF